MQSTQTIVIVGAGWTGRQIAGQMLAHGLCVLLCDPHEPALKSSKDWILEHLEPMADEGYWPKTSREQIASQLKLSSIEALLLGASDLQNVELVLESVPEQAALKRRLLKQLSEVFSQDTILASNSSYFVPSTFSKHVRAPERYAHFHFHVPIWKATVVDVAAGAGGPSTSDNPQATTGDGDLQLTVNSSTQVVTLSQYQQVGYTWNSGTKTLTLNGTRAQINADIDTIQLTPTTGYNSNFALVYTVVTPRTDTDSRSQSVNYV